jgi:uncharacterized protein YyaL (SSP411 family)
LGGPPFIKIDSVNGGDMAEAAGVRWSDWEPGALARAGAEGKLIFLDIGATWCHWCHVLDRTSLADPRVVKMLNEDFVSVRVDTDKRPDINDRYNRAGGPQPRCSCRTGDS